MPHICSGRRLDPSDPRGYSSPNKPYGGLLFEVLLFELALYSSLLCDSLCALLGPAVNRQPGHRRERLAELPNLELLVILPLPFPAFSGLRGLSLWGTPFCKGEGVAKHSPSLEHWARDCHLTLDVHMLHHAQCVVT